MASYLLKKALISNPSTIKKSLGLLYNASRNHWNYQYEPGPYPRTPAEREKAAARYGMTIEEYQPYPESMGYGDYPRLPDFGEDSKDPYYPYDCPELKRNFCEPLHARQEIFGGDRFDPAAKRRFSLPFQWTFFFGTVGGFMAAYFYLEDYKMGRPVTAKQFPANGPHYLF